MGEDWNLFHLCSCYSVFSLILYSKHKNRAHETTQRAVILIITLLHVGKEQTRKMYQSRNTSLNWKNVETTEDTNKLETFHLRSKQI